MFVVQFRSHQIAFFLFSPCPTTTCWPSVSGPGWSSPTRRWLTGGLHWSTTPKHESAWRQSLNTIKIMSGETFWHIYGDCAWKLFSTMFLNIRFLSAAEGQRPSNYSSCCCCSWIFHLIYASSTSTTVLPPFFYKSSFANYFFITKAPYLLRLSHSKILIEQKNKGLKYDKS